ncbi:MAG: CHAT domain-containing protein [Polyangiales bacterium]
MRTDAIEVTLTLEVVQVPGAAPFWSLRFSGGKPVRSTNVAPITDADLAALSDLDPAARSWAGVVTHLTPRSGWSFNAETLRQVGSVLWDRLFAAGPALCAALQEVEARARAERRPVRYVLAPIADDEASARTLELLPLELAASAPVGSGRRDFFFKRPSFPAVRCAPESSSYALDLRGAVRMLVATAHDDAEPHPTAAELAAHAEAIANAAGKLPGWTVEVLADATPETLREKVESGRYDVLHVACHGLEARDDAGALSLRRRPRARPGPRGMARAPATARGALDEARGALRVLVGGPAPQPADRRHGPVDHPWDSPRRGAGPRGDRVPRAGGDHLGLPLHGAPLHGARQRPRPRRRLLPHAR